MIRKILMPARSDGKFRNVLPQAAVLARRFNAHITVAHCRARPEDMMPFGVPIPAAVRRQLIQQTEELADVEEENLRTEIREIARGLDLHVTEAPAFTDPTVNFIEEAGRQIDVIKHHGRLADVVFVAQPDRDMNLGANTLKAALFNTGRPVLMCPMAETPPATMGEKIAIAWNGSMEASRAVALSMPLIEAASSVTILAGGKEELHGATTEDLATYLELRGISPTIHRFDVGRTAGLALLAESAAVGADLLVMGAYGDSHERETLFGGNTQVIVDKARQPVMMVH